MRNTRQRHAILKNIQEADGPLSVAQIHERAGRDIPGLGIATVYRAVKALKEGGELVPVHLPGEEPRYEPAGRGHHHHFRCRECDQTFDLDICPVGIPTGTTLPGGYRVEDHNLTLYGRCSGCLA
ncbi:MAG: Fur family transcriptional regulator [Rubrobacteraceae bacterium]